VGKSASATFVTLSMPMPPFYVPLAAATALDLYLRYIDQVRTSENT
jgi:hypothetical protein